jgi:DNA helicase HerA-like ATPase
LILGASGSGKSYLTGVVMEEVLQSDGLLCLIDASGEYHTLASGPYKNIVICGGPHGNIAKHKHINVDIITYYVMMMLSKQVSVLFDISDLWGKEQEQAYVTICETLYQVQKLNPKRRRIRLVVDECQNFAPQGGGESKALAISIKIAKEGRKYGIDQLWATQRPASVNKNIVSQCNSFWFGKLTNINDLEAIKPYIKEAGITDTQVKGLKCGEFFYNSDGATTLIKVRQRYCKHGGGTPSY